MLISAARLNRGQNLVRYGCRHLVAMRRMEMQSSDQTSELVNLHEYERKSCIF